MEVIPLSKKGSLMASISIGFIIFFYSIQSNALTNHFNTVKAKPIQLAGNTFVYNPRTFRWKAIRNGKVIRSGRGSGGAPMPYCMFFSKYYAIHGSPDVPGYNASHGCIRVKPSAARWLYHNFLKIGSKVIVKSY